jgi:hypothetical protein
MLDVIPKSFPLPVIQDLKQPSDEPGDRHFCSIAASIPAFSGPSKPVKPEPGTRTIF